MSAIENLCRAAERAEAAAIGLNEAREEVQSAVWLLNFTDKTQAQGISRKLYGVTLRVRDIEREAMELAAKIKNRRQTS
ncbi:MAG: hypothetical protein P4M01_08395 [Acidobacteriota bacterium]|nr:hypothetical protein [Acidobacteriota bacterium]